MLPILLVLRVLWSCYLSRNIAEDEGQSLYSSANGMCTVESFPPLSSFYEQNNFAKQTHILMIANYIYTLYSGILLH